jgi:hypothetical protein
MSRLFGAYVMVDWSAASKPTTGADSLWIGVTRRNVRFQLTTETFNPPTRKEAEQLLHKLVEDFSKRGDRVLMGFDFALGFPRGTAAALKLNGAAWSALIDFVSNEIKDKPDNTNNRFQVGAKMNRLMTGEAFPFWGAPAKDVQTTLAAKRPRDHGENDLPEYRYAEEGAKGASPIWKLYYQGSVGGQTLTGLPVVKRLAAARAGRVKLWPYETGWNTLSASDLTDVDLVIAEIYPSLLKTKGSATIVKDAAQVKATAEHFAGLDEKGLLGKAFAMPKDKDAIADTVTQEEGWILGV